MVFYVLDDLAFSYTYIGLFRSFCSNPFYSRGKLRMTRFNENVYTLDYLSVFYKTNPYRLQ